MNPKIESYLSFRKWCSKNYVQGEPIEVESLGQRSVHFKLDKCYQISLQNMLLFIPIFSGVRVFLPVYAREIVLILASLIGYSCYLVMINIINNVKHLLICLESHIFKNCFLLCFLQR